MKEHEASHWNNVPQAPDYYSEMNKQRHTLSKLHQKLKDVGTLQYDEEKQYRRLKKSHGDPANEHPGA